MGYWRITIEGTGPHNNAGHTHDADFMGHEFVENLKIAGHTITRAQFETPQQPRPLDF